MKFIMSYSCGKDSTLALHKMLDQGHQCVGLLVMVNADVQRSFFHGADAGMLERYAIALDLPLLPCPTQGASYHLAMEAGLQKARDMGAEAACFGDIDIAANRAWCQARCDNTGLQAVFPLWQRDRQENVYELMALGYQCLIKSINQTLLPKTVLGKMICPETVETMKKCGIDICGENGEYHTLVVDGPVFRTPLDYQTGKILEFGDYAVVDVV